jgi:hypothetical protein
MMPWPGPCILRCIDRLWRIIMIARERCTSRGTQCRVRCPAVFTLVAGYSIHTGPHIWHDTSRMQNIGLR